MTSKRVLIIDDEEDIREVAKASLEIMAGFEVILAETSQAGLEQARIWQPDIILLDVMLPDKDGIATLQELQADPLIQHIPVILLTARVREPNLDSLLSLGVQAVITKPFKPIQLAQQVIEKLR